MTDFLFNFKSQFADIVSAGEKYQTVRAIRKDKSSYFETVTKGVQHEL